MKRIRYLKFLHNWYNEEEFEGALNSITMLLKRQRNKDGWYEYKGHKDWTPIRPALHRANIVISDGCFEEDSVEGAVVHEMIHQWQCEILNEPPDHNKRFKKKAQYLEKKYGLEIE